jgi:hypothetical protein
MRRKAGHAPLFVLASKPQRRKIANLFFAPMLQDFGFSLIDRGFRFAARFAFGHWPG